MIRRKQLLLILQLYSKLLHGAAWEQARSRLGAGKELPRSRLEYGRSRFFSHFFTNCDLRRI